MGFFDWIGFTAKEEPKLNETTEPKVEQTDAQLNESFGLQMPSAGGIASQMQTQGVGDFGINFGVDGFYDTGGVFGGSFGRQNLVEIEKSYILHQRAVAMYPEVVIGIEEIMRDLFDKKDPLDIDIPISHGPDLEKVELSDEEIEAAKAETNLEESINAPEGAYDRIVELFEKFKKKPFTVIDRIGRTPNSLVTFNFIKQAYIDGRICVLSALVDEDKVTNAFTHKKSQFETLHGCKGTLLNESLVHWDSGNRGPSKGKLFTEKDLGVLLESILLEDKPNTKKSKNKKTKADKKEGKKVRIFVPLDPTRIIESNNKVYYTGLPGSISKVELLPENLIQSDFGLFDAYGARHGFLQYAFKYANQLQTLQDMLIPIRFRRSVARRVFNVDVASLPQNRAVSYMQELQQKFKYKKHYDATSGKIVSKTSEPTGIVEDYWFANRNGGKGTTVETIDEAGNFQDSLDDISYFNKKLYQSMFIPLRRIFESDASYDYTANSIEVDELRFVNFLERVRFVFDNVLTQMFAKILKDEGFQDSVVDEISVSLRYEDWYSKAKIKEDFENSLSLYGDAKEYMGKLFSAETIFDKVFGMSGADVAKEYERLANELQEDNPFNKVHAANSADDGGY